MKMPYPESIKEAEAIDYAFAKVGQSARYSVRYMVRNGWGRLSMIVEISPMWEWLGHVGREEFMKHYWKYRLGVVPCYKNAQ